MSPQQATSSFALNMTVGRRTESNITHSQKRLHHLTKVAVERAYKLRTESRRLVHIVETQTCGDSKTLGCSNPFSSLSSALLKNSSSSTTPSSSRNWALSKDSNDRCSVAARIHTLLNQWRPDSSSDWRARVASVVPVLEDVLYTQAKSQAEYTDRQLLESQLMNVLCHFEAGNGPFLLQGSSPRYPVRPCNPPSSSSNRMSPLCQHALAQGVSVNGDSHETVSEETHVTSTQTSASESSPILTRGEANDTFQNMCATKVSTNKQGISYTSSKIVKKVASMLSKKRREKSECLKQELESNDQGAETVERFINAEIEAVGGVEANNDVVPCHRSPTNSCRGNERTRSTLGGILKLDMLSMGNSSVINASSAAEGTGLIFHVEEIPLSLSTTDETSHNIISNSGAEASDPGYILDSQIAEAGRLSYSHSSGANCKSKAMSSPFPSSTSVSTLSPPSSSASSPSSSSSASRPRRSRPHSPPSSSASAPSQSRLILPHQAPLPLPLPLCSLSSSMPQERCIHTPITCLKPLPQHQSTSSFSQPLAPLSQQLRTLPASSDVPSMELNYVRILMCEDRENAALNDNNRENVLLQAKEPAPQIASEQSTTQTTPEEPRKIERGESSSTSSTTSSPSASNEELIKPRERKVKLPLRSFLAEREQYMGCISSYKEGGPWDTWEEATEPLDGMCCVCMVGFKRAAFIPCGHTFCRKCSRELWRGRGTCPLCNRYIREILDIY